MDNQFPPKESDSSFAATPEKPGSDELGTRGISAGSPAAARSDKETRHIQAGPASITHADGRLTRGTLLQERYRVMGVLGAGGMSTVYKAQDLRFPSVMRLCAVKEMINTATDPQVRATMLRNFEREASILATISHPSIPQVYDYFSEKDHSYLVLEFVQGQDLEKVLFETDGFLAEARVVNWAIQVCDVLNHLHNHKPNPIIFRDLKPSNIMLDDQERVRLVDFGIAKVFQSGEKGTMIGTEGYSPPEQYRGIAEPRGDVYALGATIHHLLSKQDPRLEPPFSFQDRPIHKTNPTITGELQDVINRCLEYDINQRFGSVEEMKRALMGLRPARGGTAAISSFYTESFQSDAPMAIWQFACEDEIRSAPAIGDGVIYVTAYDNNLYALDSETGKFLWKYAAEGCLASSPCLSEGKVFFGSEDRILYAVNAETGRLAWTCPTKGRIYSSPQAQMGHIFFGSDDRHLYAVNTDSGRVVWTFEAEAPIRSSPAIGSETIYFGDEGGSVYAVGTSGQLVWRFRARRAITSSPLLGNDMIYVGSQDWSVYALDLRAGWSAWRCRTGGPIISSPTMLGTTIYVGSADGNVYAIDAANGYVVWKYQTEGQVASSPLVHNNVVYIGSTDGYLYALDATTGQLRWSFQTSGPVISSPRIEGDTIYLGSSDHYVYALPA